MNNEKKKIYSVTEITQAIKNEVEPRFSGVWITGEISNYRTYASGHSYFSVKDESSQINAMIFSNIMQGLKFRVEDGIKVVFFGKISVYAKRGEYRVLITYIEPAGKGELQAAFEQLKEKLAGEGLFDTARKRPIPPVPRKVGIVTSPDGAAIHDILTVIKRRFANIEILIYPVRVQGEEAKFEIAEAINYLNKNHRDLEVLLVGRGGGSMEDLWPFNEEIVARAIAGSRIPVISCVGHEVDFTIADFVADLRAPTPSAAAELVVKNKQELVDRLLNLNNRLNNYLSYWRNLVYQRIRTVLSSRYFVNPYVILEERIQLLDDLAEEMALSAKRAVERKEYKYRLCHEKICALSPLNVLSRGYSIVYKLPENSVLKDSCKVFADDKLRIRLHNGEIAAKVLEK